VRLPFTFNNLANTKVWDLVRECAPLSQDQLKRKLIDPNDCEFTGLSSNT
jgi:hypothetical protein